MSNTPFFSNFIEDQTEELSTEELQACSGGSSALDGFGDFNKDFGPIYVTMKHPSDDDEGADPFKDILAADIEVGYVR